MAAQRGELTLGQAHVDRLLAGVDLITQIARTPDVDLPAWDSTRAPEVVEFLAGLNDVLTGKLPPSSATVSTDERSAPSKSPA